MKTIELSETPLTLAELIKMADEDNLLVKSAEGRAYIIAEVDDFEQEVEAQRRSASFAAFLDERSKEKASITLQQAREELLRDD